ncbi:hypothetical protein QJS04_geneDACA020706 [Acorus gramineus]|uniref:DUF7036 domain-containing protein n=1 Tax=Acorus gramineus TaxID=55184 RepID=A0AAV9BX00_ACOGR|nr:hypothetical protein QJS04_geneDACA020706 [Acorus gramineus]
MGKIHSEQESPPGIVGSDGRGCCSAALASVGKAVSVRCVAVLALGICVFISSMFWLPPFARGGRSGPDASLAESATIQACFRIQKPISSLTTETDRLAYDILEEIGVPHTKVSIISMRSVPGSKSTHVEFGVLPDPKDAVISSVELSILRSSLIELVLQQSNLSLTPLIFGHPTSFEVLKFPGGITVIPEQFSSIWMTPQILFNFTLNNSLNQIQKKFDQLKGQLKYGLGLRPSENVYVQMTNERGSTLDPPVVIQASVFSDIGDRVVLPPRLKQLVPMINPWKNLGLDHSIFGRVKGVQFSSFLNQSITSLGSPSPSPSPSEGPSYSTPPSSQYHASSPYAHSPSINQDHLPPCFHCENFSPSMSPLPYAQAPESRPKSSPPALSPAFSPPVISTSSPVYSPHPARSSPQCVPGVSPSPMVHGSIPRQKQDGKVSVSPVLSPSLISSSPSSNFAGHSNKAFCLYWLVGFFTFLLVCGSY